MSPGDVVTSAADWTALRRKFAVLSRYAYLDTAQHGPVSTDAAQAARRYYEAWSHEQGSSAADQWNSAVHDCRQEIARFIGASGDEIGVLPNTSTAMTCAALLFSGEGAVLTARGEHPSVIMPWLARRFRLDVAEPDVNGDFTVHCYERAVRPDTKIIAVSLARYNDGRSNDLLGLSQLARTYNLHLVVDVTQAIGIMPVDVGVGIDVVGFAGFKWLNAGHGSGAVFVRSGLIERHGVPIAGNRSRRTAELGEVSTFDPVLAARAFELGSAAIPNVLALQASLALLNHIGPHRILDRVEHLSSLLRSELQRIGVRTQTDTSLQRTPHIVCAILPNVQSAEETLLRRGVQVSARGGCVRISVSWYNDENDIDACLAALKHCR